MSTSDRAYYWKDEKAKLLPLCLSFVLSISALGVLAQEEAGAAQKPAGSVAEAAQKPAGSVAEAAQKSAGSVAEAAQKSAGSVAEAAQKSAGSVAEAAQKSAGSVAEAAQKSAGSVAEAAQKPAGSVAEASLSATTEEAGASETPSASQTETGTRPSPAGLAGIDAPLRNIDLLNKLEDDRLPTRPRRFLKLRFTEVRRAKDEKILQLLLICVGFVGVFVAILALRSVPPNRTGP